MDQDLKNALAFYAPAPEGDYIDLGATWQWVWEVLQGDFHENPTTAQTLTGAVVSAIPFVDQLGDARDFIANCRKIDKDPSDSWAWVALALTLVGMFPVLGSLVKGALKVLFLYLRKNLYRFAKNVANKQAIDEAVRGLDRYLQMPSVRWTLRKLEIHLPYKYIADKLVVLRPLITSNALLKALDQIMQTVRQMMDRMMRWAPRKTRAQVEQAWGMLLRVRKGADEGLGKAVKPVQELLDQLVNRLRIESDGQYGAWVGKNTHVMEDFSLREKADIEYLRKYKNVWVTIGGKLKHRPLEGMSDVHMRFVREGWPDISGGSRNIYHKGKLKTFDNSMRATKLKAGEKIFRILDPTSTDNSFFWLRESDFLALKSKIQWRQELGVWRFWNENGEYIMYTVPPGRTIKVWEGRAASQTHPQDQEYILDGGRSQIFIDSVDIDPRYVGPRTKTNWGYNDEIVDPILNPEDPFLGVPHLNHKWRF